jgi:hypothetical protein
VAMCKHTRVLVPCSCAPQAVVACRVCWQVLHHMLLWVLGKGSLVGLAPLLLAAGADSSGRRDA